MSFYYLACPYAHDDDHVKQQRYEKVTDVLSMYIQKGDVVFSPITHSHPTSVDGTWESHWMNFDFTFLKLSTKLIVLQLDGWRDSKGVNAEIEEALKLGIEVVYLSP